MNLEDVLNEKGLQQDEWSLSKPTFGEEGQLKVIGWNGRSRTHKLYILQCSKCSQDSELFGEGIFISLKSSLIEGQLPCGCARKTNWSLAQYEVLCRRAANSLGFTFNGFEGEWRKGLTKVSMTCPEHGEWTTTSVTSLISGGRGCPKCGRITLIAASTKSDSVMIPTFRATGAFHEETTFWRSDRLTAQGSKSYWFMSCPECGEIGESTGSGLQKGQRPCDCSKHRQREAYINFVIDQEQVIAIKFGISRDSNTRARHQNLRAIYEVQQQSVYIFSDVTSCKRAERECKQELDCGVLTKEEMPDGWSETTWVYNLDKITEIYEKNGGTKIEH